MSLGRRGALRAGAGLLLAAPVAAPGSARADAVENAFTGWMRRHGVTQGSLALVLDGKLLQMPGFGGADGAARVPVWGLSKLVTALAVARLVGAGKLALDLPLSAAMPQRLARHGAAQGPLAALTVAQLLTHRSGLPREVGGETFPGLRGSLRGRQPRNLSADTLLGEVLNAVPTRPAGSAHGFSDLNYLLLGLAIEEAAGEPYAAFAGREVLERLGIRRPSLDRDWGVLGAAGGWALSGPEYLALLVRGVAGEALIPPAIRAWMEEPEGKAIAPGSPIFYALGQYARRAPGGFDRWHEGAWNYRWPAWQVNVNAGTLAMAASTRAAWFAAFSPNPGLVQMAELERLLFAAHSQESGIGLPDRFRDFVDAARP